MRSKPLCRGRDASKAFCSTPSRAKDGAWYFDPEEVEAERAKVPPSPGPAAPSHARAADGELSARLCFSSVAPPSARSFHATHVRPAAVRALFWEWRQGIRGAVGATLAYNEQDRRTVPIGRRRSNRRPDRPCAHGARARWPRMVARCRFERRPLSLPRSAERRIVGAVTRYVTPRSPAMW